MDTIRSFSPPNRGPQLGPALVTLFTALYRSWYMLPPKSTRRHIDSWRAIYTDRIADGQIPPSEILLFLNKLWQMNGVKAAVEDELEQAITAAQAARASIDKDTAQSLSQLLGEKDPLGYVVHQMSFVPINNQRLFDEIRITLQENEERISPEVKERLDQILADATPPYDAALQELESIPLVIRLTYELFLRYKEDDPSRGSHSGTRRSGDKVYRSFPSASTYEGIGRGGFESTSPNFPTDDSSHLESSEVYRSVKGLGPYSGMGEASVEYAEVAYSSPVEDQEQADGASGSDTISEPQPREFFPDVRFPEQIQPQVETPLVVQLTTIQRQESRVSDAQVEIDFSEPDEAGIIQPEYVEVVLSASGMNERTDVWSRTILVHADRDSQPAVFLLSAEDLGEHRLNIAFYHNHKQLGQVEVTTAVSRFLTSTQPTLSVAQAQAIAAPATSQTQPADLEVRITRGNVDNQLAFMLHSPKSQIGYHWRPLGEVTLMQENPQAYLEGKFERMSQFAGMVTPNASEEEKRNTMREIETIGEEFFEELFPEALKSEFWKRIKPLREKGIIQSLLITSDEPWIPWEMVKPYRYDEIQDEEEADGFLCQTFQFCRWLAGRRPVEKVAIQSVSMVIPDLDLDFAKQERDYFQALADTTSVQVSDPLKSRSQVLDSARNGGFQLLHFALHGYFQPEHVNRSPLILEGGDELLPEDLVGSQLRGLRRSKPIVFLNACHTARINFALTGLGGWAEKMVVDARASAFIGTLWEVNDELALAFSTKFYDELRAGRPLGQAFYNARTHIRELSPANPTWLAYTLYGDPNSEVTWQ